jgi:hypothetical protein
VDLLPAILNLAQYETIEVDPAGRAMLVASFRADTPEELAAVHRRWRRGAALRVERRPQYWIIEIRQPLDGGLTG